MIERADGEKVSKSTSLFKRRRFEFQRLPLIEANVLRVRSAKIHLTRSRNFLIGIFK